MSDHTRTVATSLSLYSRANEIIPGGVHLFSRKAELMAYGVSPIFIDRAAGSRVWDVDGNEYIDFVSGHGAILLGHAHPVVSQAAKDQIDKGNGLSLNHPLEVRLAEKLIEMIPCAEMVRFCKGGGEADLIAIRIARGATGRDKVAFCGYHGWHDWYLAANLASPDALNSHLLSGITPKGVPQGLAGTAIPWEYNNLDSLRQVLEANRGEIAAIIMEATRATPPLPGFLESVRELATEHGAVLIFDEVVTGFRLGIAGAQERFGVVPDMATYAKALSNGFALGAVVGKREVMETAADNFISSVYWADASALAAGLAAMQELQRNGSLAEVEDKGKQLQEGLSEAIQRTGELPIKVAGYCVLPLLTFDHPDPKTNNQLATLHTQEMAKRGVFASTYHYMTFAHSEDDIRTALDAAEESFGLIRRAIDEGDVGRYLQATERQTSFRRMV